MGQPLIRTEYKRSGLKAVTWRVIATLTTISIVYVYTGEIDLMVGVGILDVLIKMILYFVHERIWNNVAVGRSVKEDLKFGLAFDNLRDMENLMGY
jgi:adenylylsulfate kinase